jgi:hypothetical protein
VFADYGDDFSLLDKIKQVFPEIVRPNRAHPQFVAGCQSAEQTSVTLGLFLPLRFLASIFGSTARTCAAGMSHAACASTGHIFMRASLASSPRMASLCCYAVRRPHFGSASAPSPSFLLPTVLIEGASSKRSA